MDGTLLESERLARSCFLQACADVGCPDLDIQIYNNCVGSTGDETKRIMLAGYGRDFPFAAMQHRWSLHYHAYIDHHPVDKKPGVVALLDLLASLHIPMAIATSSARTTAETKLSRAQLLTYFDHLVCAGEAARGKPHPEPYLLAATKLNLLPAQCWAIEDSDNGVRSAHAAGMSVMQVPDELAPSDEVLSLGHTVLTSLDALITQL